MMTLAYGVSLYKILDKILYVEGSDCENPVERELAFPIKYKLQHNYDILSEDYIKFLNERAELLKKYGTEKEDKIEVEGDNLAEFKKEMNNVLLNKIEPELIKLTSEEVIQIPGDIKVNCSEMRLFILYLTSDYDKIVKNPEA